MRCTSSKVSRLGRLARMEGWSWRKVERAVVPVF